MSQTIGDTSSSLPFNVLSFHSNIVVYGIIIKQAYVDTGSLDDYETARQCVEHEKEVYRRLEHCRGVLSYIDLSGPGITLPLLSRGALDRYLHTNDRPSQVQQLAWIKQMVQALCQIHDRRVLVVDVASRNMLLQPDDSIVFCDFGASLLLPRDEDIWTAERAGLSFQTDICELGAVIYEVVTGHQIDDFDHIMEEESVWPPRHRLPSSHGLWLQSIIDACWTKGRFRTTHELSRLLDEESRGCP